MTKFLLLSAWILGSISGAVAAAAAAAASETANRDLVSDLVAWIKAGGGSVDDGQEVRRERPGHPSSPGPRGVFATEAITKGTVLASVPWKLTVFGEADAGSGEDEARGLCPTVRALARELARKDEDATPYAKLLIDPSSAPSIPETWSEAGRELLDEVLGEGGAVPPGDYAGRYRRIWREACGGDPDDGAAERALFLAATRSTDVAVASPPGEREGGGDGGGAKDEEAWPRRRRALIPFADLYNHRNGRHMNAKIDAAEDGTGVRIVATRNIRRGEQLCVSYGSDSAVILRDYGFVEFPQRWRFDFGDGRVAEFDLDAGDDGDLRPAWIVRPDGRTVDLMEREMNRLQKVEADLFTASRGRAKKGELSKDELDVIWRYHGALVNALDHTIIEARGRKAKVEL